MIEGEEVFFLDNNDANNASDASDTSDKIDNRPQTIELLIHILNPDDPTTSTAMLELYTTEGEEGGGEGGGASAVAT